MRGMTKAGAWFAGGLGVLLMGGMAWSVLQRSPGGDAEAAPVPVCNSVKIVVWDKHSRNSGNV